MRPRSVTSTILAALAIAALAGAVAWRPSRLVVGETLGDVVARGSHSQWNGLASAAGLSRARRLAERSPGDANLQAAYLLMRPPGISILYSAVQVAEVARWRALSLRFPKSAMIAAILVRDDETALRIGRDADNLLDQTPGQPPLPAEPPPPLQETAAMDVDCARGEAADPQNGFFPAMRAIELYAARHDAAAHAALARAAQCQVWRDYERTKGLCEWPLFHAAYPAAGAVARLNMVALGMLPDYGALREIARLTVSQAIAAERGGNIAGGIALRRDLAGVGFLMCSSSRAVMPPLVGWAIASLAADEPGGLPWAAANRHGPAVQQTAAVYIARFTAWLIKQHHASDAAWFAARFASAGQVVGEIRHRVGGEEDPAYAAVVRRVAWGSAASEAMLSILVMLLLGAAGWFLAPRLARRFPNGLGATADRALGIGLAAALPVMIVYWYSKSPTGFFIGLVVFVAACASSARRGTRFRWKAAVALLGLCIAVALASGLLLLAHAVPTFIYSVGFRESLAESHRDSYGNMLPAFAALRIINRLAFLLLPAACAIVFALLSFRWKTPVSLGIARGYRGIALPVAALLVIAFSGICVQTGRIEAAAYRTVTQQQTNELGFLGSKVP